jgi:hypothetical protein
MNMHVLGQVHTAHMVCSRKALQITQGQRAQIMSGTKQTHIRLLSYHLLLQLIPLLGHRTALCCQLNFHLLAYKTEAYDCFTTVGVLKYNKSRMIKRYKLHRLMEDPIIKI